MKKETLARAFVLILVFGIALGTLLAWAFRRGAVVEVHAAMPQRGGWLTDRLNARVGEPLSLRLVSDDVVHGFAIGQVDFEPVDLLPGQPVEVSLTFDQPGTYTFYCTRWCGADHWRMRGTITVTGDDEPTPAEVHEPPLYLQLGLDLDAPHEAADVPAELPSAARGAEIAARLASLRDFQYRENSPYQLWQTLRADPSMDGLSNQDLWDLIAWQWQGNTNPAALAEGVALYQRDCAACHGASGGGDGVFGAVETQARDGQRPSGNELEPAADFTDPVRMLGASSALLQGKILRGGMGTGMPSWGLIYTPEQTWALVDYLWTFQFNYVFEE